MTTATAKISIDRGAKEILLSLPCQTRRILLSPEIARRLAVTLVEYADALTRPRLDNDSIHGNGGRLPDDERDGR